MKHFSPCVGQCQLSKQKACLACKRPIDDIVSWGQLSYAEKLDRWQNIAKEADLYHGEFELYDHLNRPALYSIPAQRIVSLVPSITQTLYDLGAVDQLVGKTGFCPVYQGKQTRVIGGTKNVRLRSLCELNPDLVLANKEENTKEAISQIEASSPVWVSDVPELESAYDLILRISQLTGTLKKGIRLLQDIDQAMNKIPKVLDRAKCLYLIWKEPYMAAAKGTFIDAWLEKLGFDNVLTDQNRYPEMTIEAIKDYNPDIIFLSSEPFRFEASHQQDLRNEGVLVPSMLVDGALFSWYGSTILQAAHRLPQVAEEAFKIIHK